MMSIPLTYHPADLLVFLAEPALRSLALGCIAALVVAMLRKKRAAVQLRIWTGLLYVALAMPLLGVFLPGMNVPVPAGVWPKARIATPPVASEAPAPAVTKPQSSTLNLERNNAPAGSVSIAAQISPGNGIANPESSSHVAKTYAETSGKDTAASTPSLSWSALALAIYLLGLIILLTRLALGIRGSRKLANAAEDISPRYFPRKDEPEDCRTSAALDFLSFRSHAVGLRHLPRLKESAALSEPATVGVRRPVILLPGGWRSWAQDKLEAVLAHELSHVARRDALTQLLSLLHRAIFWFSPLSWWLDRQLTELAEQASDEAALAGGADSTLYAETLLGFFAEMKSAPRRIHWQALSMASGAGAGRAERRVDRILAWRGVTAMKKPVAMAFIVLSIPVIVLAASLRPFISNAQMEAKSELNALSPSRPVPENRSAAYIKEDVSPQRHLLARAAIIPASSRALQQNTEPSHENDATEIHGRYSNGFGPRYVIMHANSGDVSMSGDEEDLQHARRLGKKINGDFIWFERDEKSYVITDPAFLGQVKTLFAPQEELEKNQDALGEQQDELGRQQDALGEQMEKISLKVPDITPELERIHAQLRELQATGATQTQLGSVQSRIGALQAELGRLQSEAGRQQSVVGRQQSELGRKQAELGRQQAALGRQQAEIARKTSGELRRMFDEAISKGIAKPE